MVKRLGLSIALVAITLIAQEQTIQLQEKISPMGRGTSQLQQLNLPDGRKGWKLTLPEQRPLATPALEDGLLFVGGGFGSYEFYALDARTGKQIWQFHTGDDGPTAAVVKRGYVVFNTESCILYVLRAKTGEVVWQKWLGDPLMNQPAVEGDRVYMAYPGGDGNHYLICLGLTDGTEIWKVPIAGDLISAPVIDKNSVYITTLEGSVYRFDSQTGKSLWSEKKNATSAPFIWNDQVFVSLRSEADSVTPDKQVVKQQFEGLGSLANSSGQLTQKKLWVEQRADYLVYDPNTRYAQEQKAKDASVGFAAAPPSAKLEQAQGNLGVATVAGTWEYQGSRPAIINDRLYSAMGDNLQSLDAKTGKNYWTQSYKTDRNLGNRGLTPPSLTKDKIFIGTISGEMLCYNASDGKLLWSYNVGEPIRFQPAIYKGYVYCTTDQGNIYCIQTTDPADDGWHMWGGNAAHNGLNEE